MWAIRVVLGPVIAKGRTPPQHNHVQEWSLRFEDKLLNLLKNPLAVIRMNFIQVSRAPEKPF